jgi:hypothetical protein
LEKANSIVLKQASPAGSIVIGRVGGVVLAINVVKGEFLTIPAGVAYRGTGSDDAVGLVMERGKPRQVDA